MKFKLGLAMTLCMSLGMASITAIAEEGSFSGNSTSTSVSQSAAESGISSAESASNEINGAESVSTGESLSEESTNDSQNAAATGNTTEEGDAKDTDEANQEDNADDVSQVDGTQEDANDVDEENGGTAGVTVGEVVELLDEEVPLADGLVEDVIEEKEEATLVITHTLKFDVGEGSYEEVITGLKAGETLDLAEYIHIDEEIEVCSVVESVDLVAGDNNVEIQYQFIKNIVVQDEDTEEVLEGDGCR